MSHNADVDRYFRAVISGQRDRIETHLLKWVTGVSDDDLAKYGQALMTACESPSNNVAISSHFAIFGLLVILAQLDRGE